MMVFKMLKFIDQQMNKNWDFYGGENGNSAIWAVNENFFLPQNIRWGQVRVQTMIGHLLRKNLMILADFRSYSAQPVWNTFEHKNKTIIPLILTVL